MSENTFGLIALAILLALFGYVSEVDYQTRQAVACEAKGGDWNGDACIIPKRGC